MKDYTGKSVFIGIDVHKKTYSVTAVSDQQIVKKDTIAANPSLMVSYCNKYFQGADICTAYEAGFCGFHLHRTLNANKIKNLVVHPAGIEIASRERVKTDRRDSQKIAIQLAAGRLKSVYIPPMEREDFRFITRLRETYSKEKNRKANQIKSFLHLIGKLTYDEKVSKKWIQKILHLDLSEDQKFCLESLCNQWLDLKRQIREIDKKLSEQAKKDQFLEEIYQSAPGVGPVIARILANELGDMKQFPNERTLFSYTGLTPREYSSGEHRRLGHISRQGKSILRKMLVQAAWRAITIDPELNEIYTKISQQRGAKRAIVGIARRLIGRIRSCIKNECFYQKRGFNDPVAISCDC